MKQALQLLVKLLLAFSLFTASLELALAQSDSSVSITVSTAAASNGKTTYSYKAQNNSSKNIVVISIGNDFAHGVSELTAYPAGWDAVAGLVPGTTTSPSNWAATVVTTEESEAVMIEWRGNGVTNIRPNQTLDGFGVTIAGQSSLYLNSHWSAIFDDGTVASGLITQLGTAKIQIKVASVLPLSNGNYIVNLDIANVGSSPANNVTISKLILRTLVGTSSVSIVSPTFPATVGVISVGSDKSASLQIVIPSDVKKFSITEIGTLTQATSGTPLNFSSAQVVYIK